MAGLFNVENALAALAAATLLGVSVEHMRQGLASCRVEGRMQLIAGPRDTLIIVDYAHNKMSFEAIFETMAREYAERPIVSVFGATGTKATERRLELPEVAARYSQKVYITEDDPGDEPLQAISAQIAQVVKAAGIAYEIIDDRSAAIERAIAEAARGTVILVLGKGHETIMRRGGEPVPVASDAERVERIIATL
jgi:UDP-N-acetylmuramoyl-L-alanyl-D-glutamate--2,6-diaminopimelate ligase